MRTAARHAWTWVAAIALLAAAAAATANATTIPKPVALFETSLASSISATDSTMTLVSATDKDGNSLASSTYAFIIDEGTASEEFVIANCTSTACTSVQRGVSVVTGTTTVAALQKTHRRGASVKITDAPLLLTIARILGGQGTVPAKLTYESAPSFATTSQELASTAWVDSQFVDASTAETVNGSKTFTASTTFNGIVNVGGVLNVGGTTTLAAGRVTGLAEPYQDSDAATKAYADALSFAGASDASVTAKGLSEEATQSEVNAGTATGGTGARLFVNPSTLSGGVANLTDVYYATSTTVAGKYQLSVTADDIVMIWGSGHSLGANSNFDFILKVKRSGWAATTTLDTKVDSGGAFSDAGAAGATFSVLTATTTETLNITQEGGNGSNGLMVMHLKR